MNIEKRILFWICFVLIMCVAIKISIWTLIIALVLYAIHLGARIVKEIKDLK